MLTNLIYAAAGSAWTVNVSPNSNGLPGNNVWDNVTGGLMHWGLIASVIAIVVGSMIWQIAGHGHNPHWASRGRVGALMGPAERCSPAPPPRSSTGPPKPATASTSKATSR